ncbi:hypothetical protein AVEN_19362-1 [Araneus ventricosus]|uniref:Uncharacterized protein n=1 Tax=Araneus ventricosus TaxID=182803 RepID=A0A4Y2T9B9_ARAVE|nr:hypothetical protein AVEN_19362-1 [Araneus ventricosus]
MQEEGERLMGQDRGCRPGDTISLIPGNECVLLCPLLCWVLHYCPRTKPLNTRAQVGPYRPSRLEPYCLMGMSTYSPTVHLQPYHMPLQSTYSPTVLMGYNLQPYSPLTALQSTYSPTVHIQPYSPGTAHLQPYSPPTDLQSTYSPTV